MGSMDPRHMQGYHRPAHTSPCIWRLHRLWITIANTRHCSPTNITAPIAANILKDTDTVRTSDTRPKEGYIYIRTHRRRDDPRKGYTDNDRAIRDEAMADRLEAPHLTKIYRREQYQEPRGTFQEHTRKDALFIANEVRKRRPA